MGMNNVLKFPGAGILGGLLLAGLVFTGCRTPADTEPSGTTPAVNEKDIERLRAGDAIAIVFSGVANPPERVDGRIMENGCINLPLLNTPIKAEGKLVSELEKEIHDAYINGKLFNTITVNVNSENRSFAVVGEVRNPSRQVWAGHTTILSAIAAAGGFTDFADKKKVLVIRANGKRHTVNCVNALKKPELNLPVYPLDQINVPRRWW